MTKRCNHCKSVKNVNDFHVNRASKDGLTNVCKPCAAKIHDIYYRGKGKETIDEWRHKDRKLYPEKYRLRRRVKHYKELYNISYKDVISMYEMNNLCPICGIKMVLGNKSVNSLCIDHDHKTGTIRGLLCGMCNRGLGMFLDDVNILKSAISYLNKHK